MAKEPGEPKEKSLYEELEETYADKSVEALKFALFILNSNEEDRAVQKRVIQDLLDKKGAEIKG